LVTIVPYGHQHRLMVVRDVTRLAQLEKVRRDFVANVSHELRTPLTVVKGYLEVLADDLGQKPSTKTALAQMQMHTERMQRIVEDLLMLSRLETQDRSEVRDQIPVAALLAAIREDAMLLSGAQRHQIELVADRDVWLLGNEKELHSAFSNLVFNAVKYTPAGGKITLRWAADQGVPRLEVTDTGIGIAATHIPRLTERFYRVDTGRSREQGGTGLGLAIVKHVLLRHQGRLEITSQPGTGSTFACVFSKDRIIRRPVHEAVSSL
jgi:two-component system, OmpR family, phosphate regulon sensor histidine kinase PhoR